LVISPHHEMGLMVKKYTKIELIMILL